MPHRTFTPENYAAAACAGKEGFDTFQLAKQVLKRRNRGDRRCSLYRCEHCLKWHIGGKLLPTLKTTKRRRIFYEEPDDYRLEYEWAGVE